MAVPLKILAAGDSWFDYPFILGTGGSVIDHLSALTGQEITNIAHHGDGLEVTLSLRKRMELEQHLPGCNLLLVSAGGDDICGDQFCLWLNDNNGGGTNTAINWRRLNNILDYIESVYLDLIEIRDEFAPDCRIVTHDYDFPYPSEHGVCFLGPWLKPSLDFCGWTQPDDQFQIVKQVMLAFHAKMLAIESDENAIKDGSFLHITTQGTLSPDDWANEIHPNRRGFEKMAKRWQSAITSAI